MTPATMRAAVLYDLDDIRIEERPVPELRDGEMLVRTQASGICSGDVMGWYIRRKAPLVLGHEPAGIVEAVRGTTPFKPGDRVFVHHHAPCFECRACLRGDYVQCATWRSSRIDPGGIAEFFRVPAGNQRDTLRVPDYVTFENAALTEPLACVVKSLRRSGVRSGDRVYVIGLGVMGQLHVLVGRDLGAEVFASDFLEYRRGLAERNGATAFHPDEAAHVLNDGADVVICGPGTAEALQAACSAASGGGNVVMFTPFPPEMPIALDATRFYFGDLRLTASYSCGPRDTQEALSLIDRGVVTAEKVGGRRVPLADVPRAYRDLAQGRIVKPIVCFD
jgi:L-iditol 2-dehydrogenase